MSDTIDTYSTGAVAAVQKSVEKPVLHFRDRYFRQFQIETGEKIFFDRVVGKPRIAPYVAPHVPGKVRDRKGFATDWFTPAYVKPIDDLNPSEWLKRLPGEVILGNLSPQQRRDLTLRKILSEHEEGLSVLEEVQCAEQLRTGKITIEGEGFGLVTIDFRRNAGLTIALSGINRWNVGGIQVLDQLEAWALLVRQASNGAVVREITMEPSAFRDFKKNLTTDELRLLLDSQARSGDSMLKMGPAAAEKLQFKGKLGDFEIWTYSDNYIDHNGQDADMMPAGQVVMAGLGIEGVRAYGAIRDPQVQFRAQRIFSDTHMEWDPPMEKVRSQSAPMMYSRNINGSLGARV